MTTLQKLVLVCGILFQSFAGFSQNCFKILDKSNKEPIAFAIIKFDRNGLYSDENGDFCLETINKIDSITISALGYEPQKLLISKLENGQNIYLNPMPILLETVTIKPNHSKFKIKSIGYFKAKGSRSSITPNSNKQFATFIQNDFGAEKAIEKIRVATKPYSNENISAFKIRIRLYSNSTENKPDKDLLLSNVIVDFPSKTKNIEADISKYGVKIPANGVWIGVETLGYYDKNNQFILSKDKQYGKLASDAPTSKILIPLSPYYYFIKTSEVGTYEKRWEGNWVKINLHPNITSIAIMAGLTVYSE